MEAVGTRVGRDEFAQGKGTWGPPLLIVTGRRWSEALPSRHRNTERGGGYLRARIRGAATIRPINREMDANGGGLGDSEHQGSGGNGAGRRKQQRIACVINSSHSLEVHNLGPPNTIGFTTFLVTNGTLSERWPCRAWKMSAIPEKDVDDADLQSPDGCLPFNSSAPIGGQVDSNMLVSNLFQLDFRLLGAPGLKKAGKLGGSDLNTR